MQNQTVGRKFCGDEGVILAAVTRRLPLLNVNAGEARVALLAVEAATSLSSSSQILLEGDSLVAILALKQLQFKCRIVCFSSFLG